MGGLIGYVDVRGVGEKCVNGGLMGYIDEGGMGEKCESDRWASGELGIKDG